eukprot:185194_1
MASRIAALQAKLGGGAMIMGGMRPGGARPMRKKKSRQRRASLDNSALLNRPVAAPGKKKRKTQLNFDVLADIAAEEKTAADPFQESLASDINMKDTKPVSANTTKTQNHTKKPMRGRPMPGMGGGMGALLAGAGAHRRKKKAKKEEKEVDPHTLSPKVRDRTTSRSFSKGVTGPLINLGPSATDAMSKTPTNTSRAKADPFPDTPNKPAETGLKCEMSKDDKGVKVVRLYDTYDKYIEVKKGENGKGMIVTACIDSNFKALGIGIGWQLSKLGKKNVMKKSFIMLRNQLLAQASTAHYTGYEVTFSDLNTKQNPSSQPNSPNISTQQKQYNMPGTAPLKPVKPKQMNMQSYDMKKKKSLDELKPKQSQSTHQSDHMDQDELNAHRFNVSKKTRSSFKHKTCDLMENIDANTKKIKLYRDWTQYFTAEGVDGTNKGFAVKRVSNNEFGKALRALGIDCGWSVAQCGNKRMDNRMFVMLKNQVSAAAKMGGTQGYVVVFEKNSGSKPQAEPQGIRQRSAPIKKQPEKPQNHKSYQIQPKQGKQAQNQYNPPGQRGGVMNQNKYHQMTQPKNIGQKHHPKPAQPTQKPMISAQRKPQTTPARQGGFQLSAKAMAKPQTTPPRQGGFQLSAKAMAKPQLQTTPPRQGGFQLSAKAMAKLNKKKMPGKALPTTKKPVIPPLATANNVSTTNKRNAYASNQDAAKKDVNEHKITAKKGRPTTPRSKSSKIQSVEVVTDEGNIKTLKLYHELDRYIVSAAAKGPKGYKVTGFNKFGNDIKSVGIDVGWRLVKLDGKDVSRAFYQMVKNNVSVAFRNSNKKGYVVTLAAPE